MLQIKHISEEGNELNEIRRLFSEYEQELNEDICFQSFDSELKEPLKKYGLPWGDLLLASWNNEIAGCIALAKMKEEGVCEMKRLYVKPSFRKKKIGMSLVEKLVASAQQKGYTKMRLDTLKKSDAAIGLYKGFGFKNSAAYYHNPPHGVVFMEKDL